MEQWILEQEIEKAGGRKLDGKESFDLLIRQLRSGEWIIACFRIRNGNACDIISIENFAQWNELHAEDREVLCCYAASKDYDPC